MVVPKENPPLLFEIFVGSRLSKFKGSLCRLTGVGILRLITTPKTGSSWENISIVPISRQLIALSISITKT